ncbi:uncharacterized protein LOC120777318 isoform X2 [Bactrocera tryoni]|uniref:uncharacterized protein LOC120777318 isoform X2 n=1 Tax=Bactrocera tryoni TaxID=59916 RepID=UPI001A984597|nr:uncharacterized protein LOC120777318 isoform X2 [Bactrocera tryoni]
MSNLDIYDDTENLISSDEYSEEDDDELMNVAISSQQKIKRESSNRIYDIPPSIRSLRKEQRLPFKRKLCSKYKARALKWLSGKAKREKTKEYLLCLKRKNITSIESLTREREYNPTNNNKEVKLTNNVSETIDLDESDVEDISPHKNKEESEKELEEEIREIPKEDVVTKPQFFEKPEKEFVDKQNDSDEVQSPLLEKPTIQELPAHTQQHTTKKRSRSPSPMRKSNCNENKKHQPERPTSTQLYRQINELFPKYDGVLGNHVKHNGTTLDAIDENMTRLMLDIQTLNEILEAKETEWNRLQNLKKVKEEILARLERKKHILGIKEGKYEEHKYNLQALKELETYLSKSHPSTSVNVGISTTHQLIENRASMKTEELQRERNNTNRLQNILISNNILQRAETPTYDIENTKNYVSAIHQTAFNEDSPELQKYQYLEQKMKSKIGRQGPFVDVKSMVADFRQQNPVVFPRVGKRIKTIDGNYSVRALSTPPNCIDANNMYIESSYNCNGSNYTPTLEKLLSTSSRNNSSLHSKPNAPATQGFKFNSESQKSYYRLQSDSGCNEISITPVNCINRYQQRIQNSKSGLLRTALDVNSQHNAYYDVSDYVKSSHKAMRNMHNSDLQLCQECKMHEARFVCAGCGNQWYCSRECQISLEVCCLLCVYSIRDGRK